VHDAVAVVRVRLRLREEQERGGEGRGGEFHAVGKTVGRVWELREFKSKDFNAKGATFSARGAEGS
jgi:hypothetical protein